MEIYISSQELKKINDLTTTITNDSENKKDILRLSNYADGLFFELKQTDNLPLGIKLKIFVGDKYKNNDLVNVYGYVKNNDKLKLVSNKVKVEKGYIEFDVIDATDYFVTMSTIPSSDKVVTSTKNSSSPILLIIIGILSLLVIGLIIAFIIKNKKNKKDDDNNNGNVTRVNNYENLMTDTNTINTVSSTNSSQNNNITSSCSIQQNSVTSNVNYND